MFNSNVGVRGEYTFIIRDAETNEIKDEFSFTNDLYWNTLFKEKGVPQNYLNRCLLFEVPSEELINSSGNYSGAGKNVRETNTLDNTVSKNEYFEFEHDGEKRLGVRYRRHFIFIRGIVFSAKSIVIGHNFGRLYEQISFADIKRNGQPFTLNLTVNDLLQVNYSLVISEPKEYKPVTTMLNYNGVSHRVTISRNLDIDEVTQTNNTLISPNNYAYNFNGGWGVSHGLFKVVREPMMENGNRSRNYYDIMFKRTSTPEPDAPEFTGTVPILHRWEGVRVLPNNTGVHLRWTGEINDSIVPPGKYIHFLIFNIGLGYAKFQFDPPLKKVERFDLHFPVDIVLTKSNIPV